LVESDPDVDDAALPWDDEVDLESESELVVVAPVVVYPGGYCIPVETPFDPVYTGNAIGSLKPAQNGSILNSTPSFSEQTNDK
jgi:hypothetical protein